MSDATAFIGLGANLGDATQTLRNALDEISHLSGVRDCQCSAFFASAPLDAPGPHYVNAVARLRTSLAPLNLLSALQSIELEHGRVRSERNAPRTLDLDLLWYDDLTVSTPRLTLPHPRMTGRAFVLRPLAELVKPFHLSGESIDALLDRCADQACESLGQGWTKSRPHFAAQ
jgi:2-amino-4-hydroxy-6-hydroxymethyldihydropteridine diphosphokinase